MDSCGCELYKKLLSEATFVRAFAFEVFAQRRLAALVHDALKEHLGSELVRHISRNGAAIEARERPGKATVAAAGAVPAAQAVISPGNRGLRRNVGAHACTVHRVRPRAAAPCLLEAMPRLATRCRDPQSPVPVTESKAGHHVAAFNPVSPANVALFKALRPWAAIRFRYIDVPAAINMPESFAQ